MGMGDEKGKGGGEEGERGERREEKYVGKPLERIM